MPIIQTTFNSKTRAEFLRTDKNRLGYRCKVHKDAGTYVIHQDLDKKEIFGISKLSVFGETGKVYRDHHLLDIDIYSDSKYNRYDICISGFKEICISYDDLALLLGIDNQTRNNITRNTQLTFVNVFCKQPNDIDVLKRLEIWVRTIFNST